MTFFDILYTILISPLQLLFETVFMLTNYVVNSPGISIIVLSLAINFLVLPLYKRADAMQEEERDIEAKLHDGIAHIKKTFKGDERMMMLQAYYRQNNYKPTYVFKGSISLLLEIPFFIAAYQFLSNLELFQQVPFGILSNLGAQDGLLVIGSLHINILPIIMTAVNLVSCVIFTKGYPLKSKIQLYAMAIFFFFFLYDSPSGLVFYWTLNNVFSLVKTIFYKLKNPKKILNILFFIAGIFVAIYSAFFCHVDETKRRLVLCMIGALLTLPLLISIVKKNNNIDIKFLHIEGNSKVFFIGALCLTVLVGALIPSAVIQASPQEFVNIYYFLHPDWYIVSALCFAIGTFIVWLGVFYKLANKDRKKVFDVAIWIIFGVALVDYLFFGKNMGNLSSALVYDKVPKIQTIIQLISLCAIFLVSGILFIVYKYFKKFLPQVLVVCLVAFSVMSIINVVKINKSIASINLQSDAQEEMPSFELSKTGKNVIVIMEDRAMNDYFPYLLQEKPELAQIYSGFTYYPNTISYGVATNFGLAGVYGGYEYTPKEMNLRDQELLGDKHDEALKIMPALFTDNGYKVSVGDPTYAGYLGWVPDLSIYDEWPDINTFIASGKFLDSESKKTVITANKRNFFYFSLMRIAPDFFKSLIYDFGNYNQATYSHGQKTENNFIGNGIKNTFLNAYTVLENLTNMTKITDESINTFLIMTNDTTHEPALLQEPEYVPSYHVDNTEYEMNHADRFTVNGQTLNIDSVEKYMSYQTNMAAILRIGSWLEYLKANDVYDNTRIIIVADHGADLNNNPDLTGVPGNDNLVIERVYPLLLVKDFNSTEFTTNEEFMTNADVPTLAMAGLIENPINPFTGKEINSDAKQGTQYILYSDNWDISYNNGNQFLPGDWYSVHDDMRDRNNWVKLNYGVLPEEK